MPRSKTLTLAGWGNYPVETCPAYRPERVRDAADVVSDAPEPTLISRGLGRGYGDAALNGHPSTASPDAPPAGALLLHERLARMIAFDPATGVLDAEAGVSIADILDTFVPRGWFPPVTPGTKYVTLGGAVAADVHGKNHHRDGAFSEFVESLTLLTAGGDVLTCSRTENPDAFRATVGGM